MAELIKSSAILQDFIKVQQNLPHVPKDGSGNYGSHMKLETLMPKVLEVLNKYNFALIQAPTVTQEGSPALRTVITHHSGEVLVEDTMLLMLDKQTAQGQGSGITYARRYALCSLIGLVADLDDDGQKATDESGGKTKPVPAMPPANDGKVRSSQLKQLDDLLESKGVEKDKRRVVIEGIIGQGKSARDLTFLEAVKLIDDIKASSEHTLANLAEGAPF